jgi:hypothetical protein
LEILNPASKIEKAIEFDLETYKKDIDAHGDNTLWIDERRDPSKKQVKDKKL